METEEIWKDIEGYEGLYQISNLGRVKSLERWVTAKFGRTKKVSKQLIKEKIRKISFNNSGYALVVLAKQGHNKTYLLHRLVAKAFVDNPNNLNVVNHKDENPKNNRWDNLEWCNITYNNTYRDIHLRRNKDNVARKIIQYDLDMHEIKRWNVAEDAARFYRICSANIFKCCRGERIHCAGFKWRYYD